MSHDEPGHGTDQLVQKSSALFEHVEHLVYIALGVLLSLAALLGLASASAELWHGLSQWTDTHALFTIVDRLLFILLIIEILHTVRASIRTGGLTPEPFLVVGLIASIRRVLVITLQTSEATKPGEFSAQNTVIVQTAMLELAVIGGLILALVVSLYLLARAPKPISTAPDRS